MHAFGDKCEAGDEYVTKIEISVLAAHLISLKVKTLTIFSTLASPRLIQAMFDQLVASVFPVQRCVRGDAIAVGRCRTGGMRLTDNSKLLVSVFRGQSEEVGGMHRQLNLSRWVKVRSS